MGNSESQSVLSKFRYGPAPHCQRCKRGNRQRRREAEGKLLAKALSCSNLSDSGAGEGDLSDARLLHALNAEVITLRYIREIHQNKLRYETKRREKAREQITRLSANLSRQQATNRAKLGFLLQQAGRDTPPGLVEQGQATLKTRDEGCLKKSRAARKGRNCNFHEGNEEDAYFHQNKIKGSKSKMDDGDEDSWDCFDTGSPCAPACAKKSSSIEQRCKSADRAGGDGCAACFLDGCIDCKGPSEGDACDGDRGDGLDVASSRRTFDKNEADGCDARKGGRDSGCGDCLECDVPVCPCCEAEKKGGGGEDSEPSRPTEEMYARLLRAVAAINDGPGGKEHKLGILTKVQKDVSRRIKDLKDEKELLISQIKELKARLGDRSSPCSKSCRLNRRTSP